MAESRGRPLLPAAALSFTAALIHASVAPAHFQEYWGFGVFFVVVGLLQLGWAELVRRGDADRRILIAGAVGNLAIAVLWLVSRTAGLPVGPEVGQAEGIGLHDALASLDEVTIAAIVGVFLAGGRARGAQASLGTFAWALAGISFVGAFLGSHSGT